MGRRTFATLFIIAVLPILSVLSSFAQLTNYQRLYSFGIASRMGVTPAEGVIVGSDGWLYGATRKGGRAGQGTIYKIHPSGNGYSVLHHFSGGGNGDTGPWAALLEGRGDGALYGTTYLGGNHGAGTVFKINKDGSGFVILHHFAWPGNGDGFGPLAGLMEGSDHHLYGTTRLGGPNTLTGSGTLFRISKDGSDYAIIHNFANDGDYPLSSPVEGQDGVLYGTVSAERTDGRFTERGAVYKVNKDGSGFRLLKAFAGAPSEPANVQAGLIEGKDGALYGVSARGGAADLGTIFKIHKDGQNFTVLHSFSGSDGRTPVADLLQGQDGALYGSAFLGGQKGMGTVFTIHGDGTGFAVLHHLQDGTDGNSLRCKLAQIPSGELFGTSEHGGRNGSGTIFALNTNGQSYQILWHFEIAGGDTRFPRGLIEGPDGVLYGTGWQGGVGPSGGGGAIFKINKDGRDYTVLRHLGLSPDDVKEPGRLILGSDGKLYGPASGGIFRINRDGNDYAILRNITAGGLLEARDGFLYGITGGGGGRIFKMAKDGTGYAVLKSFITSSAGGIHVFGPGPSLVLQGGDGFLYGTTQRGIDDPGREFWGTIYKISADGNTFTVLRTNLNSPLSLIEAGDHVLYGTMRAQSGFGGTVYKINLDGTGFEELHVVASFLPYLLEERNGFFYGLALGPSNNDPGVIFRLNQDGTGFVILKEIAGLQTLLHASDGAFYGTARGGDLGYGTIFRVGHLLGLRKQTDVVNLELTGVPGFTYRLERSVDLQSWSALQSVVMPGSVRVEFTDAAPPSPAAFYRAVVP